MFSVLCALGACVDDTLETRDELERKKPKPPKGDDPPPTTEVGTVTCFSTANPSATCTSPSHCCFDSSNTHEGACSTNSCSWGTILCDGPEDCATGEICCATIQATGETMIACSANACLPVAYQALGGEELCHEPSFCSGGRWCISAWGTQPVLPRTLSICR